MKVETVLSALPDLDLTDFVWAGAAAAGVDDPERRWASSGGLSTFGQRSIPATQLESLFRTAQRRAEAFVGELFRNYREVIQRQASGDVARSIENLHAVSVLCARRGRESGRRKALEKALELAVRAAEPAGHRMTLLLLGDSRRESGDYPRALEHYRRGFELAEGHLDPADMARGCLGLGQVRWEQGRLDAAEAHFRRGLTLADRLESARMVARLRDGLGAIAAERGELEVAADLHDRALADWSRLDEATGWGECHAHRGRVLAAGGRHELAEKFFRLALEASSDPRIEADTRLLLAEGQLGRGRLLAAEEEARRSERLALRNGLVLHVARAYGLLGGIARVRGESAGISLFETALRICRRGPYPAAAARLLYEYGRYREDAQEPDRALECYRRSAALWRRVGVTRGRGELDRRIRRMNAASRADRTGAGPPDG